MARRNLIELIFRAKDQASGNLASIENQVGALHTSIAGLAAVGSFAYLANEALELIDSYRLLQNRMRLVTRDAEELAAVNERLIDVSIRSRTSYEATANLYARVARSSRELGLSQQELINFSETVQKSIRVSGSTAAEASAGVIQFGQALASSRLSGDELRSVLEQMPRLAQAIAEGMGVGIGRLRELGEQGYLTAEAVLKALDESALQIAEEFSRLEPLISEAFVNLKSGLITTLGLLDQAAGLSRDLATGMNEVAAQMVLFGKVIAGTFDPVPKVTQELEEFSASVYNSIGNNVKFTEALKSNVDATTRLAKEMGINITQLRQLGRESAKTDGTIRDLFESVGFTEDQISKMALSTSDLNSEVSSFLDILQSKVAYVDDMGEATKRVTIAFVTMTALVKVLGRSLFVTLDATFGAAIDILLTFGEQLQQLFSGNLDEAAELGRGLKERIAYNWGTAFPELKESMKNDMTDAMETIMTVMGQFHIPGDLLDLDKKDSPLSFLSKIDTAAINKTTQEFEKFETSITNQILALSRAKREGLDYADSLKIVQLEAAKYTAVSRLQAAVTAATEAGNNVLAGQYRDQIALINEWYGSLVSNFLGAQEAMESSKANERLEELQNSLIDNAKAAQMAADTGLNLNDVLKLMEIETLGAASGNKELATNLKEVYIALLRNANIRDDKVVLENLREEIELLGMTGRERFIYLQLQKLSVDATKAQREELAKLAGELFDRQEEMKEQLEYMKNLAERAAQNIQDAFADFLFDPFDEGLKGMVKGFINAIRRMLAEMIAAEFLGKLKGIFGGLVTGPTGTPTGVTSTGTSGIPRAASGRTISAGMPVLVGERGPEIFTPSEGGRILNNSRSKSMVGQATDPKFITNIDARGADPGLIARLPQILEARDQRILAAVRQYVNTGVMPI